MGNLLNCVDSSDEDAMCRRKLVIVGDGGCGKTCLLFRALGNGFEGDLYIPTVFETEVMTIEHHGKMVELILYDTAGQEDYDRLRPFAYPDTDVILACFSVNDPNTLANIQERWIPEVRHFCGTDVPILLVGTKADLRPPETFDIKNSNSSFDGSLDSIPSIGGRKRKQPKVTLVSEAEAQNVAYRKDCVGYFESSAKANSGVTEIFRTALSAALHPKAFSKKRRSRQLKKLQRR